MLLKTCFEALKAAQQLRCGSCEPLLRSEFSMRGVILGVQMWGVFVSEEINIPWKKPLFSQSRIFSLILTHASDLCRFRVCYLKWFYKSEFTLLLLHNCYRRFTPARDLETTPNYGYRTDNKKLRK